MRVVMLLMALGWNFFVCPAKNVTITVSVGVNPIEKKPEYLVTECGHYKIICIVVPLKNDPQLKVHVWIGHNEQEIMQETVFTGWQQNNCFCQVNQSGQQLRVDLDITKSPTAWIKSVARKI